jgi:hypothetical protein
MEDRVMAERHLEEAVNRQHLPSLLNVVTGVWLIIAPFVLGYVAYAPARNNDIIVGIIVALLAAGRAFGHAGAWAAWVNVVLGAWMVVSPYMFRFAGHELSGTSDTITGLLIMAFALWSAFALPMNERGGVVTFAAAEPTDEELRQRSFAYGDRIERETTGTATLPQDTLLRRRSGPVAPTDEDNAPPADDRTGR